MEHQIFIFRGIAAKRRCNAQISRLAPQILLQPPGAHRLQRQKGAASGVLLFQQFNSLLAVFRTGNDNILQSAAQGGLHRQGETLLRFHQLGHRPVNALQRPALSRAHDRLDRPGKAVIFLFHFRQHLQLGAHSAAADRQPGLLIGEVLYLCLSGAALFFSRLDLPKLLRQLFLLLCQLFLLLRQSGLCFFRMLARVFLGLLQLRFPALQFAGSICQHLLHGQVSGQLFTDFRLGRRTVLQLRLRLCQLRRRLLQALLERVFLLPAGMQLLPQRLYALLLLADLLLQPLGAPGLLRDLGFQPRHAFPVVLLPGLQHSNGVFTARRRAFLFPQRLPCLLRAQIAIAHFLRALLRLGIERLQLFLGLLQTALCAFILRDHRVVLFPELIQRVHPDGDLQQAQFVPIQQKLLCHFRLLLQRADLHFQLLDLIADTQQVFLSAFQLALGFLLAVAIQGDAGRFLKDLPPLRAFGRDDFRNAPLPDDRIALSAQTGVHEQLTHIPQANGFFVDVVLALSTPVIPAGEHDLRTFQRQRAVLIIQDQRHLGKAHGAALFRAAEYHILHLFAAQRFGALLSHDPQNRIGDI